jgi:hypothetical protein
VWGGGASVGRVNLFQVCPLQKQAPKDVNDRTSNEKMVCIFLCRIRITKDTFSIIKGFMHVKQKIVLQDHPRNIYEIAMTSLNLGKISPSR